jgi:hypothetical protein
MLFQGDGVTPVAGPGAAVTGVGAAADQLVYAPPPDATGAALTTFGFVATDGDLVTQEVTLTVSVGTSNRPMPVYRFPRRVLTLCPQFRMGIQPDARFPRRALTLCPQLCMGIPPGRYTEISLLPTTSSTRI